MVLYQSYEISGRGGMADAPDLESGIFDVGVQVPSTAP